MEDGGVLGEVGALGLFGFLTAEGQRGRGRRDGEGEMADSGWRMENSAGRRRAALGIAGRAGRA